MATNKERTSSAAMRKLLLQSASKKEQEIQQIGSVAESTIPQPAIEHPIHEEVKESAPVKETVQEPQPEQMEKPESKPSVQSSPKTEESKVCGKKFRKFDGQIFIMYIGWYGLGRFFIEGLRVDSLVIGNMRISQLIAGICVVVSVILLLVIGGRVRRMGSDYQLYCNTEACKQMMAELDAKREASGKKAAASVALDSAKEPEDETSEPEETSEAKTDAPEENDK